MTTNDDTPYFPPGRRMVPEDFPNLERLVRERGSVVLRAYDSSNAATTRAAKLAKAWDPKWLGGLRVKFYTQTLPAADTGRPYGVVMATPRGANKRKRAARG